LIKRRKRIAVVCVLALAVAGSFFLLNRSIPRLGLEASVWIETETRKRHAEKCIADLDSELFAVHDRLLAEEGLAQVDARSLLARLLMLDRDGLHRLYKGASKEINGLVVVVGSSDVSWRLGSHDLMHELVAILHIVSVLECVCGDRLLAEQLYTLAASAAANEVRCAEDAISAAGGLRVLRLHMWLILEAADSDSLFRSCVKSTATNSVEVLSEMPMLLECCLRMWCQASVEELELQPDGLFFQREETRVHLVSDVWMVCVMASDSIADGLSAVPDYGSWSAKLYGFTRFNWQGVRWLDRKSAWCLVVQDCFIAMMYCSVFSGSAQVDVARCADSSETARELIVADQFLREYCK